MNGGELAIQILSPIEGERIKGSKVSLRITITLSCGCPMGCKGRWDPKGFKVKARALKDNVEHAFSSLSHTDFAGEFKGNFANLTPGDYILEVDAFDPESGMAGRSWGNFRIA